MHDAHEYMRGTRLRSNFRGVVSEGATPPPVENPAGAVEAPPNLKSLLSTRVEEVQALRFERETDGLVHLHAHGGVYAGHHDVGAGLDVQEDLRAQRLDDVHYRIEGVVGPFASAGQVQVLGADAQRDLLAFV